MIRASVSPKLLNRALNRAGLKVERLSKDFPKIQQWLLGEVQPTVKQLRSFAKKTHVAVGYFFSPEPSAKPLPIHDFRKMLDACLHQPSLDLLDIIYLCQQRQEWYRDHILLRHAEPLPFVGTAKLTDDVVKMAATMRQTLGFGLGERKLYSTWTEALRQFIEQTEASGVLVMVSSAVDHRTSRKLDPEEFRGFALADKLAPVVFINGSDSQAAQMFALAHELAHIWLGVSGVSNAQAKLLPDERTERWCNKVAIELLVPLERVEAYFHSRVSLQGEIRILAREFRVSTLIMLRRLHDLGVIDKESLWKNYDKEIKKMLPSNQTSFESDDFYDTLEARFGERFVGAVLSSILEGRTHIQDAFRILGVCKTDEFYRKAKKLGLC